MTNQPNYTPNVVVQDPRVRKIVGNILAVAVIVLAVVTLVDTQVPAFDIGWVTVPAGGIIAGLFSIFQLAVTSPNIPQSDARANGLN